MATPINAGSVVIHVTGNNAQFQQTLNKTLQQTESFGKRVQNLFMATAAIRATLSGFTAPLQEIFNVFSKFDFGMSKVQAITAATAAEISNLREQAKLLGKTTFFTASQVADAQKFLAMAGFNPDQILKATPNVLNLAGDMDLGMAADIATNISTPFKIAADELNRVNDILARANTSSNTNVMDLGQAFKPKFLSYFFTTPLYTIEL
jgi:hypothetical protein